MNATLAMILVAFVLSSCGFNQTPEPKRCVKVWNTATQQIVYECLPLSQSTYDGAR